MTMLRQWHCQADVTVRLYPLDPILIKSGYATLDGPDMVPVRTFREGEQTFYFPGSSLKGCLRSHFERICRTLRPGSVCIPYYDGRRVPRPPVASEVGSVGCGFRGPASGREEDDTPATAYRESCPACRTFGSLRFGGRLSLADAYPVKKPTAIHRNGVGINRFTGGTVPGVLYDLIVLEGGEYRTQLRLQNFELWQLAAVYFLLGDLRDGMIALGSGRSRGLGRVRGEVTDFTLTYLRPQERLCGLEHLASPDDRAAYELAAGPVPEVPLAGARVRGLRHQYALTDWATRLEPLAPRLDEVLATLSPRGQIVENHR
jgi:CRISPR/Cas system CSM-associated protein Csm3 (group 7 of RAMP superfamily)